MKVALKSAFVGFILLVTVVFAVTVGAKTAADIFDKVSPSVVVVQVYNEKGKAVGFGSGVVLPGGDVATNYHVVEKAAAIKVHQGGKDYNAVLHYSDPDRDVCSLSVPGMKAPTIAIGSTKSLKVGSRVYAIGTPEGLELTLSEGIISSLRPVEGGQYLQITAPISRGSSGGGLFDKEGRLIGLTTSSLTEGQQLNFAVPVEWVGELPRRNKKGVKTGETYAEWLKEAVVLEGEKDWAGLINHAMRRTKVAPGDAKTWYQLGYAYYKAGQTTKAIEAYEQAVRIDPEFAVAWNNLGLVYDEYGKTTKVIEAYEQSVRINPEDARIWNNLGSAYGNSGQTAKAIEAFRRALRINPEEADAWYNLGVACRESGQTGQVMEVYKRLKVLNPAKAEKFFNNVVLP